MKVLNNVVANDIRVFLMDANVSMGRLNNLYRFLSSEAGGHIYNAQTLMADIEKITEELGVKGKYNMEVLNVLLNGLDIVYNEDSVFYEIDKDKEAAFNVLYNETINKNIKQFPELAKVLIHGAISIGYIANLIIEDGLDINNENDGTLLEMSKWDMVYKNVLSDNEDGEYTPLLSSIGESILEHINFKRKEIPKESLDLIFKNARLYKMLD